MLILVLGDHPVDVSIPQQWIVRVEVGLLQQRQHPGANVAGHDPPLVECR